MNTPPTMESVAGKMERLNVLFARDEMQVVIDRADELHRALGFYAEKANWLEKSAWTWGGTVRVEDSAAVLDAGERARAVLAGGPRQTEAGET